MKPKGGNVLATTTAKALIELTQRTPLRGKGSYAHLSRPSEVDGEPAYAQAREELDRFWDFFEFHDEKWTRQLVEGKDLLDLGFGYGGRTVGWARFFNPKSVTAIEVYPNLIPQAEAFARSEGEDERCRFLLGGQDAIPVPDASADVLVSYDVLEHVDDPRRTLQEIHRVLRPGGHALIIFPPYHGVLAHHLGYITRLPGIHWVFPAPVLVDAINDILAKNPSFNMAKQPTPHLSHNATRYCLPTMNGLTSVEFLDMLDGFEVRSLSQTPILAHYRILGRVGVEMNSAMMKMSNWCRDAFSYNLSCVLKKVQGDESSVMGGRNAIRTN